MRRRQAFAQKADPKPVGYEAMGDDDLKRTYEAVFGKPPHWKMKRETIIARLEDE